MCLAPPVSFYIPVCRSSLAQHSKLGVSANVFTRLRPEMFEKNCERVNKLTYSIV